MPASISLVFAAVYVGMVLGELPGLRLDRAGIALLGAIALVAVGEVTPAGASIDWRTHARVGVPVTVGTLALAAMWLWVRS